jgi:hypothetical protein
MKINRVTSFVAVAFSLAAFFTTGRAQNGNTAEASPPPAVLESATTPRVATKADANVTQWIEIQDFTYDMRAPFFVGLNQLEARVDRQVSRLIAKRATMNNATTDTKDWDFAMKEMEDARSYLKSMGEELSKASPERWGQEKDKVRQAWVRTQNDYEKVKSSTTD